MTILKEGDVGVALAAGRGRVNVTYRYRDLKLDSGLVVKDVLVGVDENDKVLAIPAQSTPKIKLARQAAKEETFSVRIPCELDDVLWSVSYELGTHPSKFVGPLMRFYLRECIGSATLAKRLSRLSSSDLASRKRAAKLTLRSDETLLAALETIQKRFKVTRSDLVRGAVMAAKEDVLEHRAKTRTAQLKLIAEAV
jgi:hypothetical protein